MRDASEPEIPLPGGDVTEGIVRVGDTVRRPTGRNAGFVHALIDFDPARPAARVDELFHAMPWWAPLNEPGDVDPALRGLDALRRGRILADAYGMAEQDRLRLVEVAVLRTRRSWHVMKHHAEADGGGWRRMRDEGVGDIIARRRAWLDRNGARIEAAPAA
jgi:hypothetical protein